MKVTVIGVKRTKGDKSKAGNPFDICSVFALSPVEQVINDKIQVTGAGYEIAEITLDPSALSNFEKLTFPIELNLSMDSRPRYGRFESICTGFAQPAARAVA